MVTLGCCQEDFDIHGLYLSREVAESEAALIPHSYYAKVEEWEVDTGTEVAANDLDH